MVQDTGPLTKSLAAALTAFGDVPLEVSTQLNLTGVLGRRKRQYRILRKRGLLKELTALQEGYVAYRITPEGMGELDRWLTGIKK